MKSKITLGIFLLVLPLSSFAGDAAAGKNKSAACAACHGTNGISVTPNFPNLACQKDAYVAKQLRDFKTGARKDAMMENFAKTLSDSDIENLAAYYAALPCAG